MNTINEMYQIDNTKSFHYSKNYPSYLPKRNDPKYTNISMIEHYEFTNCMAFEMLIRTKQYKELMSISDDKIDEDWKIKIENLGLNPEEAISIKNLQNPIGLFKGLPYSSPIQQDTSSITIDDIDNGLELLIKFYLEKNEIFSIKEQKEHPIVPNTKVNTYHIQKKLTLKKIFNNLNNFYIPCIENNLNFLGDKYQLHTHLDITLLENEFIQTIADKIPKKKNIRFFPIFKRPLLRFEESRIVDIEINLDLPQKELLEYLKKIKVEYDNNNAIAKNILDIIKTENEDEDTEKKPLKTIKNNIADAFFSYDYYNARKDYIVNKNNEIESENLNNIILQEKLAELEVLKDKKSKIQTIRTNTEQLNLLKMEIKHLELEIEEERLLPRQIPTINKTSDYYIFNEKHFSHSLINSNTAYNYYDKLVPFIEKLQYKNLLIGSR